MPMEGMNMASVATTAASTRKGNVGSVLMIVTVRIVFVFYLLVLNLCSYSLTCLRILVDFCFDCVAAPIVNPICSQEHHMKRMGHGMLVEGYDGAAACDECSASPLSVNTEYFHCPECSYDLCLSCAFKQHVIRLG